MVYLLELPSSSEVDEPTAPAPSKLLLDGLEIKIKYIHYYNI